MRSDLVFVFLNELLHTLGVFGILLDLCVCVCVCVRVCVCVCAGARARACVQDEGREMKTYMHTHTSW
jgi:hypothetical protein